LGIRHHWNTVLQRGADLRGPEDKGKIVNKRLMQLNVKGFTDILAGYAKNYEGLI
jgi:hypothetical protein